MLQVAEFQRRPAAAGRCELRVTDRPHGRIAAAASGRPQPAHRRLHPPPRRSDAPNAGQSPVEKAQRRRIVVTGIAQPVQQRGAIHRGEDRPLGVPTEVRRTIARRMPDRIHRARGACRGQAARGPAAPAAPGRGGSPPCAAGSARAAARSPRAPAGAAASPGPERRRPPPSCGRPSRRTPRSCRRRRRETAAPHPPRATPISASPARSARRVQPSNGTCGSIAAMAASRSALRSTAISVLPAAPRRPAPVPR